jgi:hypothetical protein
MDDRNSNPPLISSIDIVENFYGEELGRELLMQVSGTPLEQLLELADRLLFHSRTLEKALLLRNSRLSTVPERYRPYTQVPLTAHEDIFLRDRELTSLDESPQLKHMLLFSPRILVPDYSMDWAEETVFLKEVGDSWSEGETARRLRDGLRSILPLVPWVREGIVVPAPSKESLSCEFSAVNEVYNSHLRSERFSLRFETELDPENSSIFWRDPYLAWLVVHRLNAIEPWRYRAWELDTALDYQLAASYVLGELEYNRDSARLSNLVELSHGQGTNLSELQIACQLRILYGDLALSPVATSRVSISHMVKSSATVLDGIQAPDVDRVDPIATAAKFHVPSLSSVSLSDLLKLRKNEDIYNDVRSCLLDVLQSIDDATTTSYRAYEDAIRERAEDLVRPTYEKVSAKRTKQKLASLITGYSLGKAVSMGIHGVAAFFSGPAALATRAAGGASGKLVENQVRKRINKGGEEAEIAKSIMLSVLE